MSTKESEKVTDAGYLEDYYPFMERINNEGGYTLLSQKYIQLGHEIM